MSVLTEEVKYTKVIVHPGRFAYLQTKEFPKNDNNFLITKDNDEITIVTEENNLDNTNFDKDYKWFKLIEFKITKPFVCVGFLATISKIIADKNMNILIVSTFSKDYALINEKDIDKAIEALKKFGFNISNS